MFATDRDILAIEPSIFRDVSWVGQRLCNGTAKINSGSLDITSTDNDLDAARVQAGHVALINGVAYEILAVTSGTIAEISLLRGTTDDPVLMPADQPSSPFSITSFTPQIAIVHRQILRTIGIEPGSELTPQESAIVNPRSFANLEALGALHLVLSAAGAMAGENAPISQRARAIGARYRQDRERTRVELDLDGDGVADTIRTLNIIQFERI
ncbi:MAG: hypothetical protein AB7Q00_01375 [Phycisphaerales bacterium]